VRIETIGDATLYLGDCLEILPTLPKVAAVVTDPPYGSGLSMDFKNRFKSKAGAWWSNQDRSMQQHHDDIVGDNAPFNPALILALNVPTTMFGANWYASRLPDSGGWVVWDKRGGQRDVSGAKWPMSEAELTWTNVGKGVRVIRHTWFGLIRDSEQGEHYHPTQKPVAVMEFCLQRMPDGLTLDPYMGSGTTGVACANLGRKFIGIEICEQYFDIACERIAAAYAQGRLFN